MDKGKTEYNLDWTQRVDDWQMDNQHRFYVPFDAIWIATVIMALIAGIVIGGLVW